MNIHKKGALPIHINDTQEMLPWMRIRNHATQKISTFIHDSTPKGIRRRQVQCMWAPICQDQGQVAYNNHSSTRAWIHTCCSNAKAYNQQNIKKSLVILKLFLCPTLQRTNFSQRQDPSHSAKTRSTRYALHRNGVADSLSTSATQDSADVIQRCFYHASSPVCTSYGRRNLY